MKSAFYLILAAMAGSVVANNQSLAAIVANYGFGTGASTSFASGDSDPDSTAGAIALGAGLTASGISTTSGNPADSLFLRPTNNSSEGAAFTANKYITFTVTPVSGTLSFSALSFDYARDVTASAGFYALYASTGSFTSGNHIDTNTTAFTVGNSSFTSYSVVLTGIAALQDVSTPITFRLYAWGGSTTTDVLRFDNIILTTAAIPEPATSTLLASGCMALFVLLSCRKRRPARVSSGY